MAGGGTGGGSRLVTLYDTTAPDATLEQILVVAQATPSQSDLLRGAPRRQQVGESVCRSLPSLVAFHLIGDGPDALNDASITFDCSAYSGNLTLAPPSSPPDGAVLLAAGAWVDCTWQWIVAFLCGLLLGLLLLCCHRHYLLKEYPMTGPGHDPTYAGYAASPAKPLSRSAGPRAAPMHTAETPTPRMQGEWPSAAAKGYGRPADRATPRAAATCPRPLQGWHANPASPAHAWGSPQCAAAMRHPDKVVLPYANPATRFQAPYGEDEYQPPTRGTALPAASRRDAVRRASVSKRRGSRPFGLDGEDPRNVTCALAGGSELRRARNGAATWTEEAGRACNGMVQPTDRPDYDAYTGQPDRALASPGFGPAVSRV